MAGEGSLGLKYLVEAGGLVLAHPCARPLRGDLTVDQNCSRQFSEPLELSSKTPDLGQ